MSECVVEEAVHYEPVSASKFPDIREFNREFRRFWLPFCDFEAEWRATATVCNQIPYATNREFQTRITENFRLNREISARLGAIFAIGMG